MKFWALALLPATALAHMVSMSTGELKVDGNRAVYELKMPAFEAAHATNPGETLLQHLHIRSSGSDGKLLSKNCRTEQDTFTCTATYEFPAPIDALEVTCTYAAVTVPNHVHMLRAYSGGKTDQAVFDSAFTTAEIRFKPPAPWEIFVRESGAGFLRAIGGLAPLVFLIALALAARSARELSIMGAAFIAGEAIACALAPRFALTLSPRFIEAAAALTIAYLAFEIVLLPGSGQRWLVVLILGLFHGAYFSLFLTTSGYPLASFFAGVIGGQALVLAALFFAFSKLLALSRLRWAVPALASILLTIGIVWFCVRVWA